MANPQRKHLLWKGTGEMQQGPDLLEATRSMDLDAIKQCLARDADSIKSVDESHNNAIQICIAGGASIRAPRLLEFFLTETDIDLLNKNAFGRDAIDLAIAMNDDAACEMIFPYWERQMDARLPNDGQKPTLQIVSPTPKGP